MKYQVTRNDLSTPDRLERVVRKIYDLMNTQEQAMNTAFSKIGASFSTLAAATTPQAMRNELMAGGSAPLSINGLTGQSATPQPASITQGTYATRPAATTATSGTLYYATDQTTLYQNVSGAWAYLAGSMRGTLSPDQKPTLTAADAGFIFEATDYFHQYRWSGSAWEFVIGDTSGYVVVGLPGPLPPLGGLWGLSDGTAYNVAQNNGTLSSVTTAVIANSYIRR